MKNIYLTFILICCGLYSVSQTCSNGPNLFITNASQTVSSTTIPKCQLFTASCKESNNGSIAAVSNVVSLHLSTNNVLTPGQNGDTYIGEISIPVSIPTGTATSLYSVSLVIPPSIVSGNYYLFFSADGGQTICEQNENDNFASVQVTITNSITVPIPSPTYGISSCPGTSSSSTPILTWSNGLSKHEINISQYPYGSSYIVYSNLCVAGSSLSISDPDIIPGKLYRWNMYGYTDPLCNVCKSTVSSTLYFHIPPTISASSSTTICQGSFVTLSTPSISVPSPGSVSYQWYLNGNSISNANTTSYNASLAGTYTVKLTYSGSSSCSVATTNPSNSISVTVNNCGGPAISLPSSLNFGNVPVGSSSQLTLTISNTGNSPLNVTSISYPFSAFSGNWSGIIGAGLNQNIIVSFNPASAINYNGTVTVNSNASVGTNTFSISGTGTNVTQPIINVTPTAINFGAVSVGLSTQQNFTISNTGNANLNVSGINFPSSYSLSWTNGTILPGNNQSVTITFLPTSAITYNGIITVVSNANGNSTCSVSGSGTNTIPTVNSIIFTNVIKDYNGLHHNSTLTDFTLFSGSPFSTSNPIKICADGSTSTYIKVNVSNVNGIGFEIWDGNNQPISDIAKFGFIGTPYSFNNNVEVAYTHPQYMDISAEYRNLTLHVLYNGTPLNGISFPLHIYRAPVLFVHGLWGGKGAFSNMENDFASSFRYNSNLTSNVANENNWPQLLILDYSDNLGASNSFAVNSYVVPKGIDDLFFKLRSSNFSAGKVDIIAHSMGGILSRWYIEDLGQRNYRNDVHKLITIDSPHSGSQGANLLCGPYGDDVRPILNYMGNNTDLGALENLKVNSSSMTILNNSAWNNHGVPCYAIANQIPFSNAGLFEGSWDKLLIELAYGTKSCPYKNQLNLFSSQDLINYIYYNEGNDLIVPLQSQKGGLNLFTVYSNRNIHTTSMKDQLIINQIRTKIDENPLDNSNFNSNGFNPPNLSNEYRSNLDTPSPPNSCNPSTPVVQNNNLIGINVALNNNSNGNIAIFSPSPYSINSNNINLLVNADGVINRIYCVLANSNNIVFSIDSFIDSINIPVIIPFNTVGQCKIIALGFDSTALIDIDTITFFISPSANLDSIYIVPDHLLIETNSSAQVSIDGLYSDSIFRDISALQGINYYISDTSIAQHYIGHSIFGKQVGQTTLTISYLGKSKIIPIDVYQGNSRGVAAFTSTNNNICIGGTIDYISTSTLNPNSLQWYFSGGSPSASNLTNPTITYNNSGNYTVTLLAYYATDTDTVIIQNYIHVDSPTATASSSSVCNSSSINFTSSGGVNYSWTGPNGFTSNGQNPTISNFALSDTGTYIVTVTDSIGCIATATTIVTSTIQSQNACTPLITNGLVAYYPFCGNVNDGSGNGNNGTMLNTVTFISDRFGNANAAVSFPNYNSKIWIPYDLLGPLPCNNDHSFSLWVKLYNQPNQSHHQSIAFCNGNQPGQSGINAFYNWYDGLGNNVFQGAWYDRTQMNSIDSISTGIWHHIVYVYTVNNNLLRVFVDGNDYTDNNFQTVASGWTGQCSATMSNLGNYYIGNSPYDNARFDGEVDDIGVWNRSLSLSEISQLYHSGLSASANSNSPVCIGDTLKLNASGGSSYSWTGPNGFSSNQQNPSIGNISLTDTGIYIVTVTGITGCIATATTIVTSNVSSQNTCSPIIINGLVAYYPFCGNANDVSGNGNNGTVSGATLTSDRFGNSNSAYSFDGISANINLGTSTAINSIANDFTIAYFVNKLSTDDGIVLSSFSNQNGWKQLFGFRGQYTFAGYIEPNTLQWQENYAYLNPSYSNTWFQVTHVKNGNTLSTYVNGALLQSVAGLSNQVFVPPSTAETNIGHIAVTNGEYFKGKLDDIAIYNRALSTAEISQIYQVALSASANSNSPVCVGDTIKLSASGGITYSWTGPNGFSSNLQNPSIGNISPSDTGIYLVTVTGVSVCRAIAMTRVSINNNSLTASSNSPVCLGNEIKLTASTGNSYTWSGPNGFTSTLQNPFIQNAISINSGIYSVSINNNDSWARKTDLLGSARKDATGFSIGTKGYIVFGYDSITGFTNDLWEWDQVTNTWSQKANFPGSPRYDAVAFSIGNKGYVGTGYNLGFTNDFWEYNQSTDSWVEKSNFPGAARSRAAAFSIGTKGYIGMGWDGTNCKQDFYEWDQSSDTWTSKNPFPGQARMYAISFSIGAKGYYGTGVSVNNIYYNDFWEWEQVSGNWIQKSHLTGVARRSAVSFSIGDKGFIGTGWDGNYFLNDLWEWNQSNESWSLKSILPGTPRDLSVGLSIGNKGYVVAGNTFAYNDIGYYSKEFWEYTSQNNCSGTVTTNVTVDLPSSNLYWKSLSCGERHSIALRSDGTLWAWGDNTFGQLGDGTITQRSSAVQVGTDQDWINVSCGSGHSVALKSNGTLWVWGFNADGRLGDGTTIQRNSPVQIGTDTNWVKIEMGDHTAAIKSNGTLWTWGYNPYGQIGDGTTILRNHPVQIGTDTNWSNVSCGSHHTLALKTDGSLWAWGLNQHGQLGIGTSVNNVLIPVRVGNDNNWISISCGGFGSHALKSNGTLWSWGDNTYGALGDGTNTDRNAPVQIGNSSNWVQVSCADVINTLAIQSDGSLWAWGDNTHGQLGNGINSSINSPIQITSQNNLVQVSAGYDFSGIIKCDRDQICMAGNNNFSQLGDGSISDRNIFNCNVLFTLNLKIFIQGFYSGGGLMNNNGVGGCLFVDNITRATITDADSIRISAIDVNTFAEVDAQIGILQTNGNVSVAFRPSVVIGNSYFIKVSHRNTLETWSASPVLMSPQTFYDFTTASNKAFGNNLADLHDGNFAIHSGDVNQDGNINSIDFSEIENNIMLFNTGYINEDITGDGMIESSDFSLIENNIGLIIMRP